MNYLYGNIIAGEHFTNNHPVRLILGRPIVYDHI